MFSDCDHVWWYHTECDLLQRNATTLTIAEQRAFIILAYNWHDEPIGSTCIGCGRTNWDDYNLDVGSISYQLPLVMCASCYGRLNERDQPTTIYELEFREHQAQNFRHISNAISMWGRVTKCIIRIGNKITQEELTRIITIIQCYRGLISDIVEYIVLRVVALYLDASAT